MENTEPIEVEAEIIEPAKEIEVAYTPAIISDNIAALEAYIDRELKPYHGTVIDPDDEKQISAGRTFMADLNKLKKPIDDERKRIKREYEAPLKEFEARIKGVTNKIDAAREEIKAQVDAADARFKATRFELLVAEYEGCVGPIAEVIAFDALLDNEWLRRSTPEHKAVSALYDKAAKAVEGYETLQKKELKHKDEVVRHYCNTLDLIAALKMEDDLVRKDEEMAAFKAAQEAARAEKEARRQPEPDPTPESAPQPATRPEPVLSEPVFVWHFETDFQATKAKAVDLADFLKTMGITGKIQCKGVVE